ncbi:hypothetical protein ROBYS_00410 [Roseobacter sp. OBYS 0001]|nr:hypothetical protein ROBYS_00410 [Roseobacter sp. OBYS 0001]
MTKWPNSIPPDLNQMLDQLALHRNEARNSDVWGVLQDWLQRHEVQPSETIIGRG